MGDGQELEEELRAELPGPVPASRLAIAALERSPLLDYYQEDFTERLSRRAEADDAAPRAVEEWLTECARLTGNSSPSGETLFFGLVFASEPVADEFRKVRPASAGFERLCKRFTDALDHESKERWDNLVGVSPTPSDRRQLPAFAKALDEGQAEFTQVVEARYFQLERFNDVESHRRIYRRFHLPILEAFEAKHGRVLEEFWCEQRPVGLVRTGGGERLHCSGNFPPMAGALATECDDLRQRASEFLTTKEYEQVVDDLYALFSKLLADLDRALGKDLEDISEESAKAHRARMKTCAERVEERMAHRGQRWYIGGTTVGVLVVAMLMAPLIAIGLGDAQTLFENAIFGAAGALASVLYRMNRGELAIDASQGWRLVGLAAMVRPLTGALFGAAIGGLLLSGLLPIDVPEAGPDRFYFLGALAFVAGFSERWAPDLLELTAQRVTTDGQSSADDPEGDEGEDRAG